MPPATAPAAPAPVVAAPATKPKIAILRDHACGPLLARFERDADDLVSLCLLPASLASLTAERRESLEEPEVLEMPPPWCTAPARRLDPLVHVSLAGDERPAGYAQGRTLRNGAAARALRLVDQIQSPPDADGAHLLLTRLAGPRGLRITHHLRWLPGDAAVQVWCEVFNTGPAPLPLELLTSFSLDGITPFHRADAPGRLVLHRFRSSWSAEGRLDTASVEALHLERNWQGHAVNVERFGQVGSLPVRGFFPFVALEDRAAGVTWAAQLAVAGSWQIEACRQGDCLALSGGLADREFGHWLKPLAPGEQLVSPRAWLTAVVGGLDEACDALLAARERELPTPRPGEEALPVIFNEFCDSWGRPEEPRLLALADRLGGTPVRYFVIDAGWYAEPDRSWFNAHGDWRPAAARFPRGLRALADSIRERGLVPGLWFEWETCGRDSNCFHRTALLLHRDRAPVTVADRRFLDPRLPAVRDHLERRVLAPLREAGFGYVKLDYNETLGLGVDDPASLGEGLRRVSLATEAIYADLARRFPNLVVELCASGGHRLEPGLLRHVSMASFSDAHETPELPLIAASLHRLVPARQLQVWAVLRPESSPARRLYALAGGFLGRLCLSGDIIGLDAPAWEQTLAALRLYAASTPALARGTTRRHGPAVPVWRHPVGWQGVVRLSHDGALALVVLHAFAGPPAEIALDPPPGSWRAFGAIGDAELLHAGTAAAGPRVVWRAPEPFSASVILLARG